MAETLQNLTREQLQQLKVVELSAEERAVVHAMERVCVLDHQVAAALGVTPARAGELVESIRAKLMSRRERRRGLPVGQYARHRRLRRLRRRRREAGRAA